MSAHALQFTALSVMVIGLVAAMLCALDRRWGMAWALVAVTPVIALLLLFGPPLMYIGPIL